MRPVLIIFYLLIIILTLNNKIQGQNYFRISGDFTVKVKKSNGEMNLTRGKVFYDKNYKELIYDISFPQTEKWVIKDTLLIKARKDTIFSKTAIPSINEFTIFHLALNSNLNDFGLKNSVYKITKVEKKQDLVLSYWKIPNQETLDYVIIAKKNNRLESVVMFGSGSKIVSKQFFKNYQKINAFEFPLQIVQLLYDDAGKESYQVTEFQNIRVNDMDNSKLYHSKY